MPRPDLSRIPGYFHRYINEVKENDLADALKNQAQSFKTYLHSIPADKRDYRYAEGKWSIKELLQHIIDTERIFAYRALCIARKETASLPGFDENTYADNSKAAQRNWSDLTEEFAVVRHATEMLFSSFDKEQLEQSGIASGKSIYVAGIGFILAGHVAHHQKIIAERYL